MYAEFKAQTLAHCLWMAKRDPEYALWASKQYEDRMPWLLTNLQAKVRQEIARQSGFTSPGPCPVTQN